MYKYDEGYYLPNQKLIIFPKKDTSYALKITEEEVFKMTNEELARRVIFEVEHQIKVIDNNTKKTCNNQEIKLINEIEEIIGSKPMRDAITWNRRIKKDIYLETILEVDDNDNFLDVKPRILNKLRKF